MVRWHYQWLVLHEFLPTTVGQTIADDVLANGPQHFKWRNDPSIPVEFSVAAYRFGHSQIRPSYRANFGTSASDPSQQSSPCSSTQGGQPERPGRSAQPDT